MLINNPCVTADCTGNAKESTMQEIKKSIDDSFKQPNNTDYKNDTQGAEHDSSIMGQITSGFNSTDYSSQSAIPSGISDVKDTVVNSLGFATGTCYPASFDVKFPAGFSIPLKLDKFCYIYDTYIKPVLVFLIAFWTLIHIYQHFLVVGRMAATIK